MEGMNMENRYMEKAQLLLKNRDTVGKCFMLSESSVELAGAAVFTMRGKEATAEGIKSARHLLHSKVGMFSDIRLYGEEIFICMTASQDNPEEYLQRAISAYDCLKEKFFWSTYLPFAAFSIAQDFSEEEYEGIASRARLIYDEMKDRHPFLTGEEDSPLCVMMAVSERDSSLVTDDDEKCYRILEGDFFDKNSVQMLSHILALQDGDAESKCARTMELFEKMRGANLKFGSGYELCSLGYLALSGRDSDVLVSEMSEMDGWLKEQKGFGFLSMTTKAQRLMIEGMLLRDDGRGDGVQAAAVTGMIAMVIMEEIILYSIICCTAVTTVTNTN